jgi:hypothetical protein
MSRKFFPFKRSDGVFELAILGNFGLAHAYNSTDKVTHFIEDTEGGTETVQSDSYYVQLDGGFTLPEYKSKGVHLIRNIEIGDEKATYESFATTHDREEQDDWIEGECPATDFPNLLDEEKLIPMKEAEINDS